MSGNIYLYILVMAVITYLIRATPLILIHKQISNAYIKSFLFYVPYVTLAVLIFPAILESTTAIWSGLAGFIVAIILAYRGGGLLKVSSFACFSVLLIELVVYGI